MFSPLLISIEQAGGVRVIRVAGEVDLATAPALGQALWAPRRERVDVVVDLSHSAFIDCTGMHLLFDASQAQRAAGRGFAVAHASDGAVGRALAVMEQAGLKLPVYPTRAAAIAAVIDRPRRDRRGHRRVSATPPTSSR